MDLILQINKSRKVGDIALDEESNEIPKSKILNISSSRMEIGTPDSSKGGVYVEIYSKLRGYSSFSIDSDTLNNIKKFF